MPGIWLAASGVIIKYILISFHLSKYSLLKRYKISIWQAVNISFVEIVSHIQVESELS